MNTRKVDMLIGKLREKEIMKLAEIRELGVSDSYLYSLVDKGVVVRVGHGMYSLPGFDFSENLDLIEASLRVPGGVICLISALYFHGLTTELPHQVWMAVSTNRSAGVSEMPVKFVYMTGEAFDEGVEEYGISGAMVKIFNPAKTVADCFKYRNKIGLDVALQALKDCLSKKKGSIEDILKYARICRVENIMMPYLEALI